LKICAPYDRTSGALRPRRILSSLDNAIAMEGSFALRNRRAGRPSGPHQQGDIKVALCPLPLRVARLCRRRGRGRRALSSPAAEFTKPQVGRGRHATRAACCAAGEGRRVYSPHGRGMPRRSDHLPRVPHISRLRVENLRAVRSDFRSAPTAADSEFVKTTPSPWKVRWRSATGGPVGPPALTNRAT
jgi:hypothetical protein